MAVESDYIMVNKNNHIAKSDIATHTGLISGKGLHNSKSMYKVDLYTCMCDVSCHLKTF